MPTIFSAQSDDDFARGRELFEEYAAALGVDLCFQHFDEELANLRGQYSPPAGCLLLATHEDRLAGCVALRKLDADVCEMKRLYVRPAFRGLRIGRLLAESIVQEAAARAYRSMRLDTLPSMTEAQALYKSLGFRETTAYRFNPVAGTVYMEIDLPGGRP